jgi:hypothetical protein
MMIFKFSAVLKSVAHRAAIAGLAIAFLAAFTPAATAQANESGSNNGLQGVWMVQVTLRNCATGSAVAPAFESLVTYHRGGTFSESPGTLSFAPGQRSEGHGNWSQEQPRTYSQTMIALILFDTPPNLPFSPGFFAGWQTVTHTVDLTDADHFTSAGTNAFYRFDGTLYRSGCSTAVGRRFK